MWKGKQVALTEMQLIEKENSQKTNKLNNGNLFGYYCF